MLRDPSLIPLSHQHQHALALCVRIDRASPIAESDLPAWVAEVAQIFRDEIQIHFAAEEQVLFPAAREFRELEPLVDQLVSDHAWLREQFSRAIANDISAEALLALAQRLSQHIRSEERQLFEGLQQSMTKPELAMLGKRLEVALKEAAQACIVPTEATRLRSR